MTQGRVTWVDTSLVGSWLTAAVASGDTVLSVSDTAPFEPAASTAQVTLSDDLDDVYPVASIDADAGTVTLGSPVVADVDEGEFVGLWPQRSVKNVGVSMGDDAGDEIVATVPHTLRVYDTLADGIRDSAEAETVIIEQSGSSHIVTDLPGKVPSIDGGALSPGTVSPTELAQTVIDQMDTNGQTATDAQTSAAAAAQDALDAANAAQSAQSAADAAQATANAKGKVIIQSAAPSAADQLPQNLWIDTTDDANTPKRWTGSAWAVVTDKVATDAAAAASAAQAAADAATAAASTAQASADGKTTIVYSAAAPSTAAGYDSGDTWFKFASALVVGQWRHDGTAWQPVQIDGAVLANLDAGTITTGFLNVAVLIQANAMTGDKLAFNAIDGMTITGATVRTAASGQRMQMDVDGLAAYNSSDARTSSLSSADGDLSLTGSLDVLGEGQEIVVADSDDPTTGNSLHIADGGLTFKYADATAASLSLDSGTPTLAGDSVFLSAADQNVGTPYAQISLATQGVSITTYDDTGSEYGQNLFYNGWPLWNLPGNTITYASGWGTNSDDAGPLAWQVRAGVMYITGRARKSSGNIATNSFVQVAGPLDNALWPAVEVSNAAYGGGTQIGVVKVTKGGNIYVSAAPGSTSMAWIACDISYPVNYELPI